MWFKNLVVYRLPSDGSFCTVPLEEKLASRPLQPCKGYDLQTRGWVYPSAQQRYLHTLHKHHLLALGVDRKLLPASVVNQVTKERAVELEAEQGHPVGRRQLRELKQRVADELRARAFSRRSTVRAWLDPDNGWLVVDSASIAKAEELLETMRDTLDTFAVQPLETERSPAASMSTWLKFGNAPGRFSIEQDLELRASDDTKSTVRYAHHVLDGKEIQAHLAAGKTPVRLGLSWNDRLSFILTAELQIKRIQFLDIREDKPEGAVEDAEEQFDIDFALMTGELSQMLKELTEALGGALSAPAPTAAHRYSSSNTVLRPAV